MDMWMMMVDGVLEGDVARRYAFINTLRQLRRPPELAEQMLASWEEILIDQLTLFPMALETLKKVSSVYRTGILTNGFHTVQRAKIARFRLDDYVEKVAVAEELGFHKPDPRLFWRMLEEFGSPEPRRAVLYR